MGIGDSLKDPNDPSSYNRFPYEKHYGSENLKKEVKKYKLSPEQEAGLRERLVFLIAGSPIAFDKFPEIAEEFFQYIVNGQVDKKKEE